MLQIFDDLLMIFLKTLCPAEFKKIKYYFVFNTMPVKYRLDYWKNNLFRNKSNILLF